MIVSLFLLWRIGLTITTFLGSRTFPKLANGAIGAQTSFKQFDFWYSWAQWDGGHFYYIVKNGYLASREAVYMPFFPIAIKFSSFIFRNYLISGLFVSNIAFILFLYIFYKMLKEKCKVEIAKDSLITFLLFPTTFFCLAYYSESLFLLLSIATFWAIQRKKLYMSSVFGAFATTTRLIGIFLVISIIYSYLVGKKTKFDRKLTKIILVIILFFLPIGLYSLFLDFHFNNAFIFMTSQGFWGRQIQDPISTIFSYLLSFITIPARPLNDYFDFLITCLFLGILIYGVKKIPSSIWIFSMLAVLIPASTGTLTSMPRYALASIGAFIIAAKTLQSHRNIKLLVWALSLIAQIILATLFINGYWIA